MDFSFLHKYLAGSTAAERLKWAANITARERPLEEMLPLLNEKETAIPFLWLISDIATTDPGIVKSWIPVLFEVTSHLPYPKRAHSLARYCLLCGIPDANEGEAVDQLFKWALDPDTTKMTKRSSLEALKNHVVVRPELKEELIASLEQLGGKYSDTFEAFRINILKDLKNNKQE